jgi:hypothetical protein
MICHKPWTPIALCSQRAAEKVLTPAAAAGGGMATDENKAKKDGGDAETPV